MTTSNPSLLFILALVKAQAIVSRKFDAGLGGLSLSEFHILLHLSNAKGEKMRRTDLGECIGLTASGITRLLAPMEKIGLIKRGQDPTDARVSYVVLASGGHRKLQEAMEDAEMLSEQMRPDIVKMLK